MQLTTYPAFNFLYSYLNKFPETCIVNGPLPCHWWPVVSQTSCFLNVPFADVLCRSAKKRNERCPWICLVLSAMIQKSAIRMYVPSSFNHWPGESSWGSDPTRKRNNFRRQRTERWRNDSKAKRLYFGHSLLANLRVECGGDYQIIE